MASSGVKNRMTLLVIGLLVIFAPVLFLVITLEILVLFGDIEFADLTALELLELYLIDLVLLGAFGYVVYRITLYAIEEQLPAVLEAAGEEDREEDEGT